MDNEQLTHGDTRIHEVRGDDPEYVKALKVEWNNIAQREMDQQAEVKRLNDVVLSASREHGAAMRRLADIRKERGRIDRALDALRA